MDTTNLLSNLVRIKSYSGEEEKIKTYIKKWFQNKGIKTIVQGENLLVHLEGKDKNRAFIFNAHMDTVSAGDERKWRYGPWNPTSVQGRLIGLGTSDMKAGLAATMLLAEKYSRKTPLVDLWFTFVAREETDGNGIKTFAAWFAKKGFFKKYRDLAAIFTEPTSMNEIEYGHRGNMFILAETTGGSGHASRPQDLKDHSVRKMIAFADKLYLEVKKWRKEFPSKVFEPPTVGEFTSVHAGVRVGIKEGKKFEIVPESPNKFPANCWATFDVRTTPEFHPVAYKRIKEFGKSMGVKIGLAFPPFPTGYTDPSEKIVLIAKKILGSPKLSVSQASADLGFLTIKGVKAIILGPGDKDQAHKVNEYCYQGQIPRAEAVYEEIIENWAK